MNRRYDRWLQRGLWIVLLPGLLGWMGPEIGHAQQVPDRLASLLRARIEQDVEAVSEDLVVFYSERGFLPVWISAEPPTVAAEAVGFVQVLRDAWREGLETESYQADHLARQVQAAQRGEVTEDADVAALELALSTAFFHYARHVSGGRVSPHSLHPGWRETPHRPGLPVLLEQALKRTTWVETVEQLRPPYPGYASLRDALARYHHLHAEGGWASVHSQTVSGIGDHSPTVSRLRNRLALTETRLPGSTSDPEQFDEALEKAVMAFQGQHGLAVDGRVGPQTLAALNVPVEARIRQIKLAMERWRWLPHPPPERYLLVNAAGGRLRAVEADSTRLEMKVIVGRPSTPTPLFHAEIEGVVLAPYWYVPSSIARNEILPRLQRNPEYLKQHAIQRLPGGQLRQDPGPTNPLGRLKFDFPNPFSIGLHDTPERALFDRRTCAFSHGCIRLENPIDLALYALGEDTTWSRSALEAAIDRWKETQIRVVDPIPVYVLYWTAWVDEQGQLHFGLDPYAHDHTLEQALDRSSAKKP